MAELPTIPSPATDAANDEWLVNCVSVFDAEAFDCPCAYARKVMAVALTRLNCLLADDCFFSPIILKGGARYDKSRFVPMLRLLIKCMQDICENENKGGVIASRTVLPETCPTNVCQCDHSPCGCGGQNLYGTFW